jgi:NMT1-like family
MRIDAPTRLRNLLVAVLVLALPAAAHSDPPLVTPATQGRAPTAAASGEAFKVARANDWTVTIAGGLLEGTFIRFAAELAKALDDGDNLRILPVVSHGAVENVDDMLYLRGIDIAITYSDVLYQYKKTGQIKNIDQRISYISELYVGELHVFARPEIKTLADLEGKKVGFNTQGAGPTVTGPILFERLGIHVEPVYINNSIAIEQMKSGEIAAILHTVGKPNDLFTKLPPMPGFHFIPVDYSSKFADYYVPTTLTHEDYPELIAPGTQIDSIGIPAVLASYNWPKDSDHFRRIERFINYYFDRFELLKQPSFHPKWRDVNLAAKVPGWARYGVADQKIAQMASSTPDQHPSASAAAAPAAAPGDDPLFQQFLSWRRQHQGQ